MPPTKCSNILLFEPSALAKRFLARHGVHQRLMDMHGAAGLVLHRLRHEGGVDIMLQRHLADEALEYQHLVGEPHRIAVVEIDLELGGARLVDQRVDLEIRRLRIGIDMLDQILVLGDRLEPVRLGRAFRPAGAPGRRHQRQIRIGIDLRQVEFELGARSPAASRAPRRAPAPASAHSAGEIS